MKRTRVHVVCFGNHKDSRVGWWEPGVGARYGRGWVRTFLWTGGVTVSKKALVSWENICLPGAARGLNVMNLCTWNDATILKLLLDIDKKKDCLWVQWVHSYYIKAGDMYQVRVQ
ncbi:hypothetical protein H5410_040577 [Solanum commersonii]|uniref:Uncharacterized protein n=1 Tax=Solanum commersonii TaxID=4109 RepID=A0A9J5XRA6_SOLCO|nr:hypothetical protein H5410_040577 [Solanum commersonii]